jgi:hypothetical protein
LRGFLAAVCVGRFDRHSAGLPLHKSAIHWHFSETSARKAMQSPWRLAARTGGRPRAALFREVDPGSPLTAHQHHRVDSARHQEAEDRHHRQLIAATHMLQPSRQARRRAARRARRPLLQPGVEPDCLLRNQRQFAHCRCRTSPCGEARTAYENPSDSPVCAGARAALSPILFVRTGTAPDCSSAPKQARRPGSRKHPLKD